MDSIANFITSIKNSNAAGKPAVTMPFSKMNFAIAELLSKKGFVGEVSKKNRKNAKLIDIELLYKGRRARISDVKRVSKLSRRIYEKAKNLHSFKQGVGMYVLSTPQGVLSDVEAKKGNVGGEILFKIW